MTAEFPARLVASDPLVAARDRQIDELRWDNDRLRHEVGHEKADVIALNLQISRLDEQLQELLADLAVAVDLAVRRGAVLRAIKPLVGVVDNPSPGQPTRPPLKLTWHPAVTR